MPAWRGGAWQGGVGGDQISSTEISLSHSSAAGEVEAPVPTLESAPVLCCSFHERTLTRGVLMSWPFVALVWWLLLGVDRSTAHHISRAHQAFAVMLRCSE